MKVAYFPGCTLKNKAKALDFYARECAEVLGVELEEIKDWQCCGGVFTSAGDEIATKLSSVRALKAARDYNNTLVTVCSACHNVIKQTNNAILTDETFRTRVNTYINEDDYNGETKAVHYLELLRDTIGFDKVKECVKKPLEGKKIAAYYGCMLLRPNSVMAMDDPENPSVMEDLIKALGATPVIYPMRNECCGGYVVMENEKLAETKSKNVTDSAKKMGADVIVTACPLCKYNLEKNGTDVPVVYLTELLAEAFGIKEENNEQ